MHVVYSAGTTTCTQAAEEVPVQRGSEKNRRQMKEWRGVGRRWQAAAAERGKAPAAAGSHAAALVTRASDT